MVINSHESKQDVVVVINLDATHAEKPNRDRVSRIVEPVCDPNKYVFLSSPESMVGYCRKIARIKPKLLIVGSGDGYYVSTIEHLHAAYRGMEESFPMIYHLELGSQNKIKAAIDERFGPFKYARDMFFSRRFEDLERLVEMVESHAELPTTDVCMICIENITREGRHGKDKVEKIFTLDWGLGISSNIVYDYYGLNNPTSRAQFEKDPKKSLSRFKPGMPDVLRVFANVVFRQPMQYAFKREQSYFKRCGGKLRIDGEEIDLEMFLGLYASMPPSLAMGAKTFYKADGKHMHILGGDVPPLQLLMNFFNIYLGKESHYYDLRFLMPLEQFGFDFLKDIRYFNQLFGRDVNDFKWIDRLALEAIFTANHKIYLTSGGELIPSFGFCAKVDKEHPIHFVKLPLDRA